MVGGADHLADLDVVVEEGDELLPRVLPQPHDRCVPLAPGPGQVVEGRAGRGGVHGGVDRLDVPPQGVPVALVGEPEGVADQVDIMPISA
jgi:hypothetical protein